MWTILLSLGNNNRQSRNKQTKKQRKKETNKRTNEQQTNNKPVLVLNPRFWLQTLQYSTSLLPSNKFIARCGIMLCPLEQISCKTVYYNKTANAQQNTGGRKRIAYSLRILINIRITDRWVKLSSVQFIPLTDWVVEGTWGTIKQKSSSSLLGRKPLWAILTWAGMSTRWCCAFPLPTNLQSALKDGFGEALVASNIPELCKFPSLDSCQKRFLRTHKDVDLVPHAVGESKLGLQSVTPGFHSSGVKHLLRMHSFSVMLGLSVHF